MKLSAWHGSTQEAESLRITMQIKASFYIVKEQGKKVPHST